MKTAIPLLFAALALFALPAAAVSIAINNFSFEAPPDTGNNGFNTGCPTGWSCTGAAGTVGEYSPVTTQYPSGSNGLPGNRTVPSDGSARTNASNPSGGYQALFIAATNQTVSQNTAALIQNNTTYTLDVWVGHRNDPGFTWGGAIIQILANSTVLATSGLLSDPGQGMWGERTLTFTTGLSDIHAGQVLGVALIDPGSGVQSNFDVVTLSATTVGAVPEPSTLFLLGPGLVALVAIRRRKGKHNA